MQPRLENGKTQGDLSSLAKIAGGAIALSHGNPMGFGLLSSVEPKRSGEQNFAIAQQMLDTQHKVDDAWKKLERVALNYGVKPAR